MDAQNPVETPDLLDRLKVDDWSPSTFHEWVITDLAQMETRRELARLVQDRKVQDESQDPFALGAASFILGRFKEADRYLDEASTSGAATYLKGLTLVHLQRGEEALPLVRKSLATYPDRRELHRAEVEALVLSGAVDEASEKLEAFEKTYSGDLDARFLKGFFQEKTGEVGSAIDSYQAVLEENGDHSDALFRLAYVLDLYGEDDEAISVYERIRDSQPTFPNAISNLGILYEDREEYDKAIRCFKWALNVDPYNERAQLFMRDTKASVDMYYDEEQERLEDKFNQILRTPITDFELSVRSRNCLAKMQIETLGDLVQKTEAELLSYKNFGETSLAEIKEILTGKGLHLGMSLGMDEDARLAREKAISIIFGLQKKAPPTGPATDQVSPAPGAPTPPAGDPEIYAKPVGDIPFSMRIRRALALLNVNTLGDLAQRTEAEFLATKNFGQTSMEELRKKTGEFGIVLDKS